MPISLLLGKRKCRNKMNNNSLENAKNSQLHVVANGEKKISCILFVLIYICYLHFSSSSSAQNNIFETQEPL